MKLAHIINPVKVDSNNSSYLHIAQPITFQSMLQAQYEAHRFKDMDIHVDLYITQYHKDREIVPKGFIILPDLDKSTLDFHTFKTGNRELPRIRDIIDRLHESSSAEYFVYTNVDIGLQKNFYIYVVTLINKGFDAICINRRNNIPKYLNGFGILDVSQLEIIYKQKGEKHRGTDCFIFRRDIVPILNLGNVFVGYPPVGKALREQIQKNSERFIWVKNKRVTFHIGKDNPRNMKMSIHIEYTEYNKREYEKCSQQ